MMYANLLFVLIAGINAPAALSFVPAGALSVTSANHACSFSNSSPTTKTRVALSPSGTSSRRICMAAGYDSEQGQTRAELAQTLWKAALTAGVAQTFLSAPVFADDVLVTASGLKIKKLVNGKGPLVETGDLIGVRFKGNYGNYEFDNIFSTAEPYYMRAGVGTLVKGVEEALLLMKVGDKWELTCSAELAFGNKGRPPSPGRPRIPPGAEVEYTLELIALPGKEEDIVNTREGDTFTGDAFDSA